MNELAAILLWVGLTIAWLVKAEHPFWTPRLARRVVRAAVLLLPHARRERLRHEWLAELEEASSKAGASPSPCSMSYWPPL